MPSRPFVQIQRRSDAVMIPRREDFINLETDFTAVNHDALSLTLLASSAAVRSGIGIAQVMMYLFNSIFGLPPSLDCLLTHIFPPSFPRLAPFRGRPSSFLRALINAFVRVMAKCGLRITGRERERDATAADWVFGFERTNERMAAAAAAAEG